MIKIQCIFELKHIVYIGEIVFQFDLEAAKKKTWIIICHSIDRIHWWPNNVKIYYSIHGIFSWKKKNWTNFSSALSINFLLNSVSASFFHFCRFFGVPSRFYNDSLETKFKRIFALAKHGISFLTFITWNSFVEHSIIACCAHVRKKCHTTLESKDMTMQPQQTAKKNINKNIHKKKLGMKWRWNLWNGLSVAQFVSFDYSEQCIFILDYMCAAACAYKLCTQCDSMEFIINSALNLNFHFLNMCISVCTFLCSYTYIYIYN